MEVKEDRITGIFEFVTYIGGDGYTAPIVLKSNGTTQNYLYLHRDYQGSILAITNSVGQVVEKRLFDAWGNIAKVQDGAGNTLNGLTILDRGYTGHEHLQSVGLIHMNGRLYDPKLHRFLQPDNYVQDPFNTQNYNRYGYCWNNPLKYTDPSGEIIPLIIGAIILVSAAVNVYQNWDDITGGTGKFNDIKWDKFIGYTGSGAIAGALTVYGGPYGVIWAGGAQGFLNSSIRNGGDLGKIGRDTVGGLIGGAVSYGVSLKFDSLFPKGIIGGNNIFNSVLTGATREVVSSFTGNFASSYWNSDFDFNQSVKAASNPFSLGLSAVGGGFSAAYNYKLQSSDVPKTTSPVINALELQTLPYVLPLATQIMPVFQIPPPTFHIQFLNGRIRIKPKN